VETSASNYLATEQDEFGDIVFVDTNFVGLKPLLWMQHAAANLSSADFVGKMDADTFLAPCALLADLNAHTANRTSHADRRFQSMARRDSPTIVKSVKSMAKRADQAPIYYGTEISGSFYAGTLRRYMQGGFYAVSNDVAHWIMVDPYPTANPPKSPNKVFELEDLTMGRWMERARQTSFPDLGFEVVDVSKKCDKGVCSAWDPCARTLFKHLYHRNNVFQSENLHTVLDVMDPHFRSRNCSAFNASSEG
jgi:hypothetical protein